MDREKLTFWGIIIAIIVAIVSTTIADIVSEVVRERVLLNDNTSPAKDKSQVEIQKELETHRQEEERLKAELKRKEEALREAEAKKAEEEQRRAELQRQIEAQSQNEELQRLIQPETKPSLEINADDNIWLTVSFGNAEPVYMILKKGEVMRWNLTEPARVIFGRPSAAHVFLNGKYLGIVNHSAKRAETYIYNPDGTYKKVSEEAEAMQSQPTSSSKGNKTARIRYVVPPVAKPVNLRIEVTDTSGKRTIMNRQVRSGESISTSASYSQECIVNIYLDNQHVWQERYR